MRLALRAATVLTLLSMASTVAAQDPVPPPEPAPDPTPAPDPGPAPEPDPESDPLPAEHVPELEISLEADDVRTGDLVTLTVTAIAAPGDDVSMTEPDVAPFEVFGRDASFSPLDDGRHRFRFTLELLILEPGAHTLGPLTLQVVTADGTVGSVEVPARTVQVGSHLADEPNAEPRPRTDPLPVLEEDYTLLWILGTLAGLLLAALIGFLVARWWSRRPRSAPPAPPPRPAWEVALEELNELAGRRLQMHADGQAMELVDRLSDVVRAFLGARYDFNGLESTTDEIVARMRRLKLQLTSRQAITSLLGEADLVKFAGAVPAEEQTSAMLEQARRIVRAATPVAPQPTAAAPTTRPPTGPTTAAAAPEPVTTAAVTTAAVTTAGPTPPARTPSGKLLIPETHRSIAPSDRPPSPDDTPEAIPTEGETTAGRPREATAPPESEAPPRRRRIPDTLRSIEVPAAIAEAPPEDDEVTEVSEPPVTEAVEHPPWTSTRLSSTAPGPAAAPERPSVPPPASLPPSPPPSLPPGPIRMKDGSVAVPVRVEKADLIVPEVKAGVLGAVLDHLADPTFSGKIRVSVAGAEGDDEAVDRAIDEAREAAAASLANRRTASGRPLSVRVHRHGRARRSSLPSVTERSRVTEPGGDPGDDR